MILVERVPPDQISSYGVIAAEPVRPGVYRITDLVEKPPREQAPSDLAIIGRYILTPDIFEALEETAKDRVGEIQLTNGLKRLLAKRPLYACEVTGIRHDTGNKLGFLKAVVYFALKRPDLAEPFREYLRSVRDTLAYTVSKPDSRRLSSSLSGLRAGLRGRARRSTGFGRGWSIPRTTAASLFEPGCRPWRLCSSWESLRSFALSSPCRSSGSIRCRLPPLRA